MFGQLCFQLVLQINENRIRVPRLSAHILIHNAIRAPRSHARLDLMCLFARLTLSVDVKLKKI